MRCVPGAPGNHDLAGRGAGSSEPGCRHKLGRPQQRPLKGESMAEMTDNPGVLDLGDLTSHVDCVEVA